VSPLNPLSVSPCRARQQLQLAARWHLHRHLVDVEVRRRRRVRCRGEIQAAPIGKRADQPLICS
jgi:hypothetical protein